MESAQGDRDENIGNQDPMTEYEYIEKVLPVPLTDRERLEIGEDIAAAQSKAEQAEKDKKAADDDFKGIIEGAYAEVSTHAALLRRGKRDTAVQCSILRDYRIGSVKVTRMDTMEVIEYRPMSAQERQMGMRFPSEEGRGK